MGIETEEEREMIEKFIKDIQKAQSGNEKIKLTKEQLGAIEALIVGYMIIAKNEVGFDDSTVQILLGNLDEVWDSNFEVTK